MKGERELERLYRGAARELRERIFRIDPLGITPAEADKLRLFTRSLVRALDLGVAEWAMTYLREAYRIGAAKARVSLEILGRKPVRPAVDAPEMGLIDSTVAIMHRANASIPETVDDYLNMALAARHTTMTADVQEMAGRWAGQKEKIEALAAEAVQKQKSRSWLQARIKEIISHLIDEDGYIIINNRTFKATYYAKLVARTSLRKAQTEATKEKCREYGNDLVQWSDHQTECEECIPFEGEIYSISGKNPRYEQLTSENTPPIHPNCLHSLLPTSDAEIDLRKGEGWEPYR